MYQIGDYIIYGNNGVCLVENISPAPLPELNPEREYYTLLPLYDKVQIYAPVDTTVFMRSILSVDEVHRLLAKMPDLKAPVISTSNSTELAGEYRKLLASHDCKDLLRLIKSIRKKNKKAEKEGRRIGLTDSRFLKQAEDLLFGEFSVSLQLDREEIPAYIDEWLLKLEKGEVSVPPVSKSEAAPLPVTKKAPEPPAKPAGNKKSSSTQTAAANSPATHPKAAKAAKRKEKATAAKPTAETGSKSKSKSASAKTAKSEKTKPAPAASGTEKKKAPAKKKSAQS